MRRYVFSKQFERLFRRVPKGIRERAYQKLDLWIANPSHPSLRIKSVKGRHGVWEMSITMNYRITFQYENEDTIRLRKIGTHDVLRNP